MFAADCLVSAKMFIQRICCTSRFLVFALSGMFFRLNNATAFFCKPSAFIFHRQEYLSIILSRMLAYLSLLYFSCIKGKKLVLNECHLDIFCSSLVKGEYWLQQTQLRLFHAFDVRYHSEMAKSNYHKLGLLQVPLYKKLGKN